MVSGCMGWSIEQLDDDVTALVGTNSPAWPFPTYYALLLPENDDHVFHDDAVHDDVVQDYHVYDDVIYDDSVEANDDYAEWWWWLWF